MSSMSMKSDTTVDRRAQIQTLLNEQGVVNSQELAERFEVSLMTIYRDLDYLQEQGVAKRQHGGAVSADRFISPLKRSLRESQNVDAKRLIGRWAAEHLINQIDDSLIVDSGTTTLEFVRALPDVPINVMVNSLDALSILAIHKNTNVYALGGELRKDVMAFEGAITTDNLRQCHFSKAFISADGIDIEAGLTTTNEQRARLTRLMAEHAQEVYLLADCSKYGKRSFRTFFHFDRITAIISESGVPELYKQHFRQHDIRLIEVNNNDQDKK